MDAESLITYALIFLVLAGAWFISSQVRESIITGMLVQTASTNASVTVKEFISVTLQEGYPINFPELNPGTSNQPASTNPSNLTIGAETNVGYNITINATSNFVGSGTAAGHSFLIGNMSFNSTNITTLTPLQLNVDKKAYEWQDCPCGTEHNRSIWYYISVPAGQIAGPYQANITIKVVKSTG
ncbi:hypothetical protein DRN62_01150 [Nanoarchaeota archaeon]|nr:MAG: hypothetical protein DRN62_01150 [Nanoarchaeota archaeon]